ncbi:MAG: hypothetical protein A3F11_07100 [Gammaproteobacteria bacterium RIFCSPHIGHO2_12_FULL_37_14]|nr:MAG: hypothetical protein A3F11_07100 [Gammaproteobacteria bacterium RIFCSPHIGHO2_12_FULL_37_14]
MKQIFMFIPKSNKTLWIFKSKINDKTRISICLKKLDKLHSIVRDYDSFEAFGLGYFQAQISQSILFFKRESDRMKKLIKAKTKSDVTYVGDCGVQYDLSINSTLSTSFYELLQLFDDLMCLSKTCFDLKIFEEKKLMYGKIEHYKKCIKMIIHNVCQYKISTNTKTKEVAHV